MIYLRILKHYVLFCMLMGMVGWSYGQGTAQKWPGNQSVSFVDAKGQGLENNSSGISYQPPLKNESGYLWIVKNRPPTLYKMKLDVVSGEYVNLATDGWNKGKILKYTNGKGKPDAEGVTKASWSDDFIYVATEKEGLGLWASLGLKKRQLSILRYDVSTGSDNLIATHEWNLADDIKKRVKKHVGMNTGWEAITWIPDSFLTSSKYYDDSHGKYYDPSDYSSHYEGLFFVGLEQNGYIYSYALMGDGKFSRITEFPTGWNQIVGLEFDRENNVLWANCDNDCSSKNELKVFHVDSTGHFVLKQIYEKPEDLGVSNYEGIAFFPDTQCISQLKKFFWVDDDSKDGNTIIRGEIQCPLP